MPADHQTGSRRPRRLRRILGFKGIVGRFYAAQKILENQTPQKASKNSKIRPLNTQSSNFEVVLGVCFLSFSMPFCETPKPRILQQVSSEMLVFASQRLPFRHQKSIPKLRSSQVPSQTSCFYFLYVFFAKMCDFWIPLGSEMAPQITQGASKGRPPLAHFRAPVTALLQGSFLERSWPPFWLQLDGFLLKS